MFNSIVFLKNISHRGCLVWWSSVVHDIGSKRNFPARVFGFYWAYSGEFRIKSVKERKGDRKGGTFCGNLTIYLSSCRARAASWLYSSILARFFGSLSRFSATFSKIRKGALRWWELMSVWVDVCARVIGVYRDWRVLSPWKASRENGPVKELAADETPRARPATHDSWTAHASPGCITAFVNGGPAREEPPWTRSRERGDLRHSQTASPLLEQATRQQ